VYAPEKRSVVNGRDRGGVEVDGAFAAALACSFTGLTIQ
jgi:hypothetical protein